MAMVRRGSQWGSLIRKVGIIGAPLKQGQPKDGVENGPKHLREAGLVKKLQGLGCRVQDYGDLQFADIANNQRVFNMMRHGAVGAANKKISEGVSQVLQDGNICLTLGGDHSVAIGSVHGHAQVKPNLCLLWVDAHADINPPLASITGNIHGMPLSFLIRELTENVPKTEAFDWLKPCISIKDIAYIGLRDLDPAERYVIDKTGIASFDMHEVDKLGIAKVIQRALEAINPNLDRPIHLSFDIDAMDPTVAPCTGTPVPGGLTIREGMYMAEELALTGKLSVVDMVEVNPALGGEQEQKLTSFAANEVIAASFGKWRGGNIPPNYELPRHSFQY